MAQEAKRGCGFREVGGLYLCGDYIAVPCDRLPYELHHCPTCGEGIKMARAAKEVNAYTLLGIHSDCKDKGLCFVCLPPDRPSYIMFVGSRSYTPESFMAEAEEQGVSKRIAVIPKKMILGETVVYLSHPEAVTVDVKPMELGDDENMDLFTTKARDLLPKMEAKRMLDVLKREKRLGIFGAFIPQRIEMPIWDYQMNKARTKRLAKRGITPVPIHYDTDHDPKEKKKRKRRKVAK